jgi:hypothetical protein
MTRRTVVVAPGEPRFLAWLFHQQAYWLWCRWFGHRTSFRMCTRCGTLLQEYDISDEYFHQLMAETPLDLRPMMGKIMRPDTLTVGRP